MIYSPAEILAVVLFEELLGTMPEKERPWPVYVDAMPVGGNEAICIYNTEGIKQGRLMEGPIVTPPGLGIRIRAPLHRAGWGRADAIARFLDTIKRRRVMVATSDYLIHAVSRTGPIHSL